MKRKLDEAAVLDQWVHSVEKQLVRAAVTEDLFGDRPAAPQLGGYEFVRRIGAGGMGVVFEARDPRTAQRVALKVLRRRDAHGVRRLKREFRAMSDLHHPNLVQLYELSLEAEVPFFSMELIEGDSLWSFVRPSGTVEPRRLWHAARQLVDGVSTLHAARVLHRDLKPSNLLVEHGGRLVVLDFGLARALDRPAEDRGAAESGTLLYMAPERWSGKAAAEASDWYSVGVILSELLALIPPKAAAEQLDVFSESPLGSELSETGLAELLDLCRRLLSVEPADRPSEAELLRFFGLNERRRLAIPLRATMDDGVFAGRQHELEQMQGAFVQAQSGACVIVQLSGEPGIGKTALAAHFIDQLQQRARVTVLTSRCYERELIPYNALDGVIDALARALPQLPEVELTSIGAMADLGRLFPALREACGTHNGFSHRDDGEPALQCVRDRAFTALRMLVQAVSAVRPLVIYLDDLHWADTDSAQVLSALLRPPAPSHLLLIACFRSSDTAHSPGLQVLEQAQPAKSAAVHRLELGPLSDAQSLTLAAALARDHSSRSELERLSREAKGSPLFLRLLMQHRGQLGAAEHAIKMSFQELLLWAMRQLPAPSQRLLQLCALGGRPLDRRLFFAAAHFADKDALWIEHATLLQRIGWLRSVRMGQYPALECYHDRVREIIARDILPELKSRLHEWLARAAESLPEPDAEFLAIQYEGAECLARAAHYAELAGDSAFQGIALEHAAELYTRALRCSQGTRSAALVRKLADALASTGRCSQSVPLYLEAAEVSDDRLALRLRLRAAEMLLRSGLNGDGARIFKPLLRTVGLSFPASIEVALLSVFVNGLRLRLQLRRVAAQGLRRSPTEIERRRGEVCFNLGCRMLVTDPIRACSLLMRSFLLALECGTDDQFARALAGYATMLASVDVGAAGEQNQLMRRAWELARKSRELGVTGWLLYFHSFLHYVRAEFRSALDKAHEAQRWFDEHPVEDAGWFSQELETVCCGLLSMLGHVVELDRRSSAAHRRAQEAGNAYHIAAITCSRGMLHLARDDSETAMRELDEIVSSWPRAGSYLIVAMATWTKLAVLLYRGDDIAAWHLMRKYRRRNARAGYTRLRPWVTLMPITEGTIALACAQLDSQPRYLRSVQHAIARLRAQRSVLARLGCSVLDAGLAQLQGQSARAAEQYGIAVTTAESLGMTSMAMCTRMRHADLLDEPHATRVRSVALSWFRAQGIVHPMRWVRVGAPVEGRVAPH